MNTKIYVDKGAPFIACQENKLSDGSITHDIYFRGNSDPIPAMSEKRALEAMTLFAKGLETALGERPLVL